MYEKILESRGHCGHRNNSRTNLQGMQMKEKDVEELAKSVGTLVEKILKLVLDKKDEEPENQNDTSD